MTAASLKIWLCQVKEQLYISLCCCLGSRLLLNKPYAACFHRKADGVVAGSALTMPQGIKNLIRFGFPVVDAVRCATANPAEVMNYSTKGRIAPFFDADIAVFNADWEAVLTIIGGEIIVNRVGAPHRRP